MRMFKDIAKAAQEIGPIRGFVSELFGRIMGEGAAATINIHSVQEQEQP
jgi:hypothetical protein